MRNKELEEIVVLKSTETQGWNMDDREILHIIQKIARDAIEMKVIKLENGLLRMWLYWETKQ